MSLLSCPLPSHPSEKITVQDLLLATKLKKKKSNRDTSNDKTSFQVRFFFSLSITW